jgi:predicted permease
MNDLLRDLRYAWRMLLASPAFTLVAVLSLALGIGANVTIFTLVNAVFLQPLPVARPAELVSIYTTQPEYPGFIESSHLNLVDLEEDRKTFSGVAAFMPITVTLRGLRGEEPPERIAGDLVSADYFDVLGVRPALGRTFLPAEEKPGAEPVVVLSHGFWRRRFGGDESLVGKSLTLNGQKFTVVGVAQEGFRGTSVLAVRDLWVPLGVRRAVVPPPVVDWFDGRVGLMLNAVGRLRPGVSFAQAEAATRTMARRLEQEYPEANEGRSFALVPFVKATISPNGRRVVVLVSAFLMTMVALVLALACANVANLLLFRALGRRREIAARLALGAGRGRVVRQLLTESLLLAFLGGAAGLLLAVWGRSVAWALRPPTMPDVLDLSFDLRVLGFALGITVLTGVLFGLAPALQTSRPDVVTALKDAAAATPGRRRSLVLNLLVVGQIALSLVLLIGTGLFVRSFRQAQSLDPGFAAGELLVLSFNLGSEGYDEPRALGFLRQTLEEVSALPGVRSVALASNRPFGIGLGGSVYVMGRQSAVPDEGLGVQTDAVSPGYFQAAGIPLLSGRDFNSADGPDAPLVAIVNETLAERLWPGGDPLGQRLGFIGSEDFVEVVGIARDARYESLAAEPRPYLYFALPQSYGGETTLYVRTGDPAGVLDSVRRTVQALDPNLPLVGVRPVSEIVHQLLWAPRTGASLLAFFGLLGLVLAGIGAYGIMSYSVDQRRREIGIRMALGELRRDVMGRVLRRGLALVGLGLALGLAAALATTRLIGRVLYDVSAHDPVTFAVAPLVLAAAALLAMLLPARRATAVDPVAVLRSE